MTKKAVEMVAGKNKETESSGEWYLLDTLRGMPDVA